MIVDETANNILCEILGCNNSDLRLVIDQCNKFGVTFNEAYAEIRKEKDTIVETYIIIYWVWSIAMSRVGLDIDAKGVKYSPNEGILIIDGERVFNQDCLRKIIAQKVA